MELGVLEGYLGLDLGIYVMKKYYTKYNDDDDEMTKERRKLDGCIQKVRAAFDTLICLFQTTTSSSPFPFPIFQELELNSQT